jgi:hypothetical protein
LTSSAASKDGDFSHDQEAALLVRGSLARLPGRLPAHPRYALPRFATKIRSSADLVLADVFDGIAQEML